jgi:Zn/Cd-binding protein ZinT
MNAFYQSQPNTIRVLKLLIDSLNVPVSFFTMKKDLKAHPDYPSMLSLSDCLSSWNIDNQAFKLDKENCNLKELPVPFVAHLKIDGGRFILVNEINDDIVAFSDEVEKKGQMTTASFVKDWHGILLYAKSNKGSGEKSYREAIFKEVITKSRVTVLILLILSAIFITVAPKITELSFICLLGLKIIGIAVCTLLVIHSINADNPLIANLCSLGRKNDCNAILKSDAAKVTNWLSWSEVGLFYFSGSLLGLLLLPDFPGWFSIVNLVCLPYTFYSVGYQIKTKNWCILCCSVQVILWLELLVFYFSDISYFLSPDDVSISTVAIMFFSFVFPIAIWSFLKPIFAKASQVDFLNQQLKIFKFNGELFQKLLTTQKYHSRPEGLMPIVLGNPKAEIEITMISNPFCGPCASTHKKLFKWISERDDLKLAIVFVTANHDDDHRTKVARHTTALSFLEDKSIVERALDDWYGQTHKKYETWAEKYPVLFTEDINAVTDRQLQWCDELNISFTPTILINGYKLIEPYTLDDIKHLI